jgi:hypothetical protein
MPLEIVGDIPAGRPALEAAVLRGLTVATVPALTLEETESRLRSATVHPPCDLAECWAAVGRSLQARYLVTGTVERKGPLFAVEFRVVDARLGRVLATESNRCEANDCSVAELCRVVVREMARQTLNQAPEPPAALPATAAAPLAERSLAAGPGTPQLETTPMSDEPPGTPRLRRWAIPAIATGIAVAAGGGVMLRYQYKCANWITPTLCKNYYGSDLHELLIGGIAGLGVGAALVTTGIVLLFRGDGSSASSAAQAPKVSLGPGGISLYGRF